MVSLALSRSRIIRLPPSTLSSLSSKASSSIVSSSLSSSSSSRSSSIRIRTRSSPVGSRIRQASSSSLSSSSAIISTSTFQPQYLPSLSILASPSVGTTALSRVRNNRKTGARLGYNGGRRRGYHDYVRGITKDGTPYKIHLDPQAGRVLGIASSRGWREYQEDRTSYTTLELDVEELRLTHRLNSRLDWDPGVGVGVGEVGAGSGGTGGGGGEETATDAKEVKAKENGKAREKALREIKGQVSMFGIFDGHGGQTVSEYLHSNLHRLIESVSKTQIDDTFNFTKALGGYFRRFRGGSLQKWVGRPDYREKMTVEERLTLAFLTADKEVLSNKETQRCGSTASLALLHSLDSPGQPYFSSQSLSLITAHLGDTSILLCRSSDGKVESLTERHHADSRVEAARLRRLGAGTVTDSFGESRWMGILENTRSFGDGEFKPLGVTAEPEIQHRMIKGSDYSSIIFVTDGISGLMSNQEIVDLTRNASDPSRASKSILNFAEDLGAQDNCTVMVVPLAGWGKIGGIDETEERREYRKRKAVELNTRMQRM